VTRTAPRIWNGLGIVSHRRRVLRGPFWHQKMNLHLCQGWQLIKLSCCGVPPPPGDSDEQTGNGRAIDLAASYRRGRPSKPDGRPVLISYKQRNQAERLQWQC
jgi:hypothetical protein